MKRPRKHRFLEERYPVRRRKRLICEPLESRILLAGDVLDDVANPSFGDLNLDDLSLDQLVVASGGSGDGSAVATSENTAAPGSLDAYLDTLAADTEIQANFASVTAAAVVQPRHNPVNPFDVNVSGSVEPADALLVINHITGGDPSVPRPNDDSAPGVFDTDVDGDGNVTESDAHAVLAALSGRPVQDQPAANPESKAAPQSVTATSVDSAAEGESGGGGGSVTPFAAPPPAIPPGDASLPYITKAEVDNLLSRAAGASASEDAIIAIVDRGGRILGVRVEDGVLANISDPNTLIFAIDGAVAKARTAAFFANDQAPLTSRTIRSLSQTTILQREVESNPTVPSPSSQDPFNNADPISRTFGPGVVAAIGVGGHFPPDVAHTPPVDLFNIELQSRDGLKHPGADGIKGTPDDITLSNRFNVPTAQLAAGDIPAPESYGVQSGINLNAQGRGIATLPGGIPLYKTIPDTELKSPLTLVGGIGVFFPGLDGYATHEQGFIAGASQTSAQRLNASKELEAEFIAAKTAGVYGSPVTGFGFFDLTKARIDLVGIMLEIVGPNPTASNRKPGLETIRQFGQSLGTGDPDNGMNMRIDSDPTHLSQDGQVVPEGWIVWPHASPMGGITQADVQRIVTNSIIQANSTRAAIRLDVSKNPPTAGTPAKMVIAVADKAGNILGLYRMHDATIFSIDVAVAKARNTAYYADPTVLQNADKVDDDLLVAKGAVTVATLNKLGDKNNGGVLGTPDLFTNTKNTTRYSPLTGLAFTNRTFRFLAEPRYPSGVDGSLPPVFSILADPAINRKTAENIGLPDPASLFTSVVGFDAFHASRNFHDPGDVIAAEPGVNTDPLANQNGIVFFPGSTPLYKSQILVGGFGISGDGVDQDDVVTAAGQVGYAPPQNLRADMVFYRGVRLPFQKFNRNPQG